MLTRELARSHSPYYFMLGPRRQREEARRQGGRARVGAKRPTPPPKGPATRLQWGVELRAGARRARRRKTRARIERVAGQIIGELEATPETFYERNRRALERIGKELAAWNKDKRHEASLQRIRAEMASGLRQAAGSRSRARHVRRRASPRQGLDRVLAVRVGGVAQAVAEEVEREDHDDHRHAPAASATGRARPR